MQYIVHMLTQTYRLFHMPLQVVEDASYKLPLFYKLDNCVCQQAGRDYTLFTTFLEVFSNCIVNQSVHICTFIHPIGCAHFETDES